MFYYDLCIDHGDYIDILSAQILVIYWNKYWWFVGIDHADYLCILYDDIDIDLHDCLGILYDELDIDIHDYIGILYDVLGIVYGYVLEYGSSLGMFNVLEIFMV